MRSNLGLLCFGMMLAAGGCQLVNGEPTGTTGSMGSSDSTSSGTGGSTGDDACKGVPT